MNVTDSAGAIMHSWRENIPIPGVWISNEFENPPQWTDEIQDSPEQDSLQQDLWENLPWYKRDGNVVDENQIEIRWDNNEIIGQQSRNAA